MDDSRENAAGSQTPDVDLLEDLLELMHLLRR
jgi:hypothetical protein